MSSNNRLRDERPYPYGDAKGYELLVKVSAGDLHSRFVAEVQAAGARFGDAGSLMARW